MNETRNAFEQHDPKDKLPDTGSTRSRNSPRVRPPYPKDISVDRYGFIKQTCAASTANLPNGCRHGSLSQRLPGSVSSANNSNAGYGSSRSTLGAFRRCPIPEICADPVPYRSALRSPSEASEFQSGSEGVDSEDSGNEITDVLTLQRHELKWLDMFRTWPLWMDRNFHRLKRRCRKGIPMSVRGRAWRYLSGAVVLENLQPTLFSELAMSDNADPRVLAEITKDLHRSFPNHELFYSMDDQSQYNDVETLESNGSSRVESAFVSPEGPTRPRGQSDLYSVLKAYSLYNKKVGYCQALAPIASVLLMHLPADQAFWVLVCICRFYMRDYYDPGLNQFKRDGELLKRLLVKLNCPCSDLLTETEPILYMTEWFMCLYSRSLPWASVLRVWDMFFCEGPKVLFKVAIAWLNTAFERYKSLKSEKGTSLGDLMDCGVDFSSSLDVASCKSAMASQRSKTSIEPNGKPPSGKGDHFINSIEEQGELLKIIKQTPRFSLSPSRLFRKIAQVRVTDRQLTEICKQLDRQKPR